MRRELGRGDSGSGDTGSPVTDLLMYATSHHNIVIILQFKKKKKEPHSMPLAGTPEDESSLLARQ